jgi:hypothetical protein
MRNITQSAKDIEAFIDMLYDSGLMKPTKKKKKKR